MTQRTVELDVARKIAPNPEGVGQYGALTVRKRIVKKLAQTHPARQAGEIGIEGTGLEW